jgi:two-component system, OmpR family, response regulator RegX3
MQPFAETSHTAFESISGDPRPPRRSLLAGEGRRSPPSRSTPNASVGPTAVPRLPGTRSGAASILVVEDEESYQEALLAGLTREGFDVELASDGADALERFADHPPDLVLLDLLLPRLSGIDVFRRMRAIAPVPVIIVSALSTETDIVLGLELGAEDYIAKPYRLRELVARIRSVLRRVSPPPHIPERDSGVGQHQEPMQAVTVGPFRIDFSRRVVTAHGAQVHLSRREFDLLALLLSPPGRVRTRDELIDRLWSGRDLADTRTLDTHIRRLRVKLEVDPTTPTYLLTVRGVGFRFEPDRSDTTPPLGG